MLLRPVAECFVIYKQSNRHPQKMKNAVRITCIALSVLALVYLFDCRAWASERVIEKIRFEKLSLTEERVSFKLGEYAPPRVFGLEGEKGRLVCDFFDTRIKRGISRTIQTDGNLILRIRVGLHTAPKQKVRVVMDLAPFDKDYTVEQHFYENNVFVVTVLLR
ncbi:MAG: AMIN domain-containing protein [Deltaproteobacteria bacterium]|nr:AMIN domain-containing protein [Deltaproteobacteria bacterium]